MVKEVEFIISHMEFIQEDEGYLPKFEFIGMPKFRKDQHFNNGQEIIDWLKETNTLIRKNIKKKMKFTISWDDN